MGGERVHSGERACTGKTRTAAASSTTPTTSSSWSGPARNGCALSGIAQSEILRESGLAFAVVGVNIEYRRPARLDDELTITCSARARRQRGGAFRPARLPADARTTCWSKRRCASPASIPGPGARSACRSFSPRRSSRHEPGTVHHPPRRRGQHSRADRDRHPAARLALFLGHHLPQAHGDPPGELARPTSSRTASGRAAICRSSIAASSRAAVPPAWRASSNSASASSRGSASSTARRRTSCSKARAARCASRS